MITDNKNKISEKINTNIQGVVDYCDDKRISGWLIDFSDVTRPLNLIVLIDDIEVCTGIADEYRQDLENNPAFNNSCHAYNLNISNYFADGKEHEIKVIEAETKYLLNNSPIYVIFPKLTDKPKESRLDLALVGKENWLFLCNDSNDCIGQYMRRLQLTPEILEQYKNNYQTVQEYYRSQNIHYLLTIVPGKESIYSEFLPDSVYEGAGLSVTNQFISAINPRLEVEVLDLKPLLLANKPKGQLFYKNDSHWNFLGAMIASQAIINKLREQFHDMPEFNERLFTLIEADEGSCDLSKKNRLNYIDGQYIERTKQTQQSLATCVVDVQYEKKAKEIFEHPYKELSASRPTRLFQNNSGINLPRAIIVRDSYADWMIPFLSEYFSESLFVWARNVEHSVIESFKPNIVIEQVVDRFLITNRVASVPTKESFKGLLPSKSKTPVKNKKFLYLCSTGRAGSSIIMKTLGLNHSILMRDIPPYETRTSQCLFAQHLSPASKDIFEPVLFEGFKYSFCQQNDESSLKWLVDQRKVDLQSKYVDLTYQYYDFVASIQNKLDSQYILEKAVSINLSQLILQELPDSKIIFSVRDPRDTFISMMSHNKKLGYRAWGPGIDNDTLFANIINYYPKFEKLLAENPLNLIIIRYENFIYNPENEIRNILSWLGLEIEDSYLSEAILSMKQVDKFSTTHMTSGKNSKNSINQWKNVKFKQFSKLFKKYEVEIKKMGY